MKNKFLIVSLGVILGLFIAGYSLAALSTIDPININVSNIGEGSVVLNWGYNEDSANIKQFKILLRKETINSTEAWIAKYPSSSGGTPYSYSLRGLETSTNYEWRIKAEAEDPANDSTYSDGPSFTTIASISSSLDLSGINGSDNKTIENVLENTANIQGIVDSVINLATTTGFVVGPLLIVYAAFIIMTGKGTPETLTRAKNIILWTVISLFIILFAKGIPAIVKGLF